MKVCSALLNEINFENELISPCCNVKSIKIPTFPYKGSGFKKDAYIEHILQTLKNLQLDEALCKGCERLLEVDNLPKDDPFKYAKKILHSHPIKYISINHFRNFCNCKCVYCSLWNKKQPEPYHILPSLQNLQDEEFLDRTCRFSCGGGEPSILKEFEQTSLWILKNKYFQKIHTNAIVQSESIATILKADMCNVDISLDAGTVQTHKKIKGLDIWRQVLKTCQYYRKHAIHPQQISLKYIVFEQNNDMENIKNFLNICEKMDCKNIEISLNFQEINKQTVSQKTLDACRYLYHESIKNGFTCTPFFIPEKYLSLIKTK